MTRQSTFDDLVAEHGGMLWRVAAVYEADPHLREDLYQEILLAVWRAVPRFRDEAGLRTYLARIAHNRAVSHVEGAVRRGRELVPGHERVDAEGPLGHLEARKGHERLQAAVRDLPLGWQQAVTLTLEGFKPREIADVLGVSPNVVSIRLSRAKKALRRTLTGGAS